MGKIIKKRIEYGGSSNSAENIKYDDTKNVKEAINEVKSEIADANSNLQNKANWNNNISATSFNDLTSPGICINNLEDRPSDIPDDWACVTLVYSNGLSVIQIANFMYGESNKVYMHIRWYDIWRQWTLLS